MIVLQFDRAIVTRIGRPQKPQVLYDLCLFDRY